MIYQLFQIRKDLLRAFSLCCCFLAVLMIVWLFLMIFAVFDHHLLGVVVVEITLEDLDFAHPRPTKIRLFGAAPDDFGVSEADVPEK